MPAAASAALPYWRLAGYYFFHFAFIGAFSPYFGLYLQSIRLSPWEIGLLMSQMQLMRVFGPYVWGTLADRSQRRLPIIRLAGVFGLLGFTAFFFTDRFAGLFAAMAVMAFFWSAALPLVETLTFDHLRDATAGYSRIRLWGSIGFIAAVLLLGVWLDFAPLRSLLFACLGIFIGILACACLIPEAPPAPAPKAAPPLGAILRQPPVQALLLACFAMAAAHGAFYVFFSIHLAAHAYGSSAIGLLWTLGVVAEIGVFMLMHRLLPRFGRRRIMLLALAAAVLRFLLTGWLADVLFCIIVAQLLHGLTFAAWHGAAISAVNRFFPGRAKARGQAIYSSVSFGAGGLLGGLFSGWSWEALGAAATYGASSAFALIGLLIVWRRLVDEDAP